MDKFKTQVLLLHSEQSTLDDLSSGFSDRYTVHCASSGSEALKTLVDTPINVIITAHDLPGMSGLDALREAKKRSPDTIGILLAGKATADIHALVGDEEVFQVVSGDVTGDGLLRLVDNATRQMRLMALAKSANDTTANVDMSAEHIVMETSENGSTIISDGTGRMPILDPKKVSAAANTGSRAVDILVLTKDQEFLETIKGSSRGMHEVYYANTLAQAEEAIRKHKIGVAVVDAAMVGDKIEQLMHHLRKGSGRLVSIVAGRRDDGEMLIDLINRGKVYRFLMKPVSPGRARLAVEASVKQHLEAPDAAFKTRGLPPATKPVAARPLPKLAAKPAPVPKAIATAVPAPADPPFGSASGPDESRQMKSSSETLRSPKIIGIGGVAIVIAAGALFWIMSDSDYPVAQAEKKLATPSFTEADVVFDEGPLIAKTPVDTIIEDAKLARDVEQALSMAESAMLESRIDDAAAALQRVTAVDPQNSRLPFLNAQLTQMQLRAHLNEARTATRENRFEDAATALGAARDLKITDTAEIDTVTAELSTARSEQQVDDVLAKAAARLDAGNLLSPANDNARYYYELLLSNDAEDILVDARALDPANSEVETNTEEPVGDAGPHAMTAVGQSLINQPPPQPEVTSNQQQAANPLPAAVSSLSRTKYVAPSYPRSAQRRNLSGWVDVVFTVTTDGTVRDVDVRNSEPGDIFVNAAVKAVEKWEFEPVIENGILIDRLVGVRMMFALE